MMLKVEQVRFRYHRVPVLKGVTLQVGHGELCGLFGPNGCGKTTLFKCCLGFLRPQGGRICLAGSDIKGLKVREMAKLAAYVPQDHKPPFPYRVLEVVLMGRTPHLGGMFGIDRGNYQKAEEAMELLEIREWADQPYNALSGGQRQLVLIARAIAQEARVIFLDEPTSALDFHNQVKIWGVLRSVTARGITILACCHDPNHVSWFCDRVVVMDQSGVIADGPPDRVMTQETLDRIYEGTCSVHRVGSVRMVLPSGLAGREGMDREGLYDLDAVSQGIDRRRLTRRSIEGPSAADRKHVQGSLYPEIVAGRGRVSNL